MIDTQKVKLMAKAAVYEDSIGKKDLRMYRWKQETYVGYKVLQSLVCITLSFLLLAGIYSLRYLDAIIRDGIGIFKDTAIHILILYGIVLLVSWIFTYFHYKKLYREARKRVVRYDKNLYALDCYLKDENTKEDDIL